MITIKNSKELAKYTDENKDLFLKGEDVRIEFSPSREELRDVYCGNLFMMDDKRKFDFNGGDFNGWNFYGGNFNGNSFNGRNFDGWDFNGRNFKGWDFNGVDFHGRNFNGRDFNGWDFNGVDFNGGNFTGRNFDGRHISYYGWFIAYGDIKCESIKGRRKNSFHKCLDGNLIIKGKPEDKKVEVRPEASMPQQRKCKHHWEISSLEQYQQLDGNYYCYIICPKCGRVRRVKVEYNQNN